MSTKRELIIELRAALSGELRADAAIIIAAGKIEDGLKASAAEAFGESFTLKVETVTRREGAGRKKAAEQEPAEQPAAQEIADQPAAQEAAEQPAEEHHPESRRHRNGSAERATA